MATRKQTAANRRNAKKSTGPKTPEGKARSARNAVKHGLLSRRPVLPEEDGEQFEELRTNLFAELWPETALEKLLVHRLAGVQWRLARIPTLEAELFERFRVDPLGNDEGLGAAWARDAGPYGGALTRLARYETMLERSAVRLLAELRRLQAERRKRDQAELEAEQARERGPWWERAAAGWPGAPEASSAQPPSPKEKGANDAVPSAQAKSAREERLRMKPDESAQPFTLSFGESRAAQSARGEVPSPTA
jgi:hypothetical protein